MPGSISLPMRRTPSAAGRQRGQRNRPSLHHRRQLEPSCSRPLDEHAHGERDAGVRGVRRDPQRER